MASEYHTTKKGKEFARIIGEVDFFEDSFVNFLKKYL